MKRLLQAFIFAVQFLTRIPIRAGIDADEQLARLSLSLFPLVGWLVGGMLYCLCIILMLTGSLSPLTVAVFIVAAETVLTGAFHLDGLADSFDAFLSPAETPQRKLEIMKDSRIGVMGAVALMLSVLLKICLLSECIRHGLIAAVAVYPAMGRLAQVVLYKTAAYVRPGGIGQIFSKAATPAVLCWAIATMLPALFLPVPHIIAAFAVYALFLAWYRYYALRHIGGITGDILGSVTVLSEIVFLSAFTFILAV